MGHDVVQPQGGRTGEHGEFCLQNAFGACLTSRVQELRELGIEREQAALAGRRAAEGDAELAAATAATAAAEGEAVAAEADAVAAEAEEEAAQRERREAALKYGAAGGAAAIVKEEPAGAWAKWEKAVADDLRSDEEAAGRKRRGGGAAGAVKDEFPSQPAEAGAAPKRRRAKAAAVGPYPFPAAMVAHPSPELSALRRNAQSNLTVYTENAEALERLVIFACKTLLARA
jgi:hypothetical protein